MANDAAKGLTSLRVRLLGTAMGCTALMLAAPAMAQQAPVKQHQTSALAVTTAVAAEDEPLDDPSIVSQDPVAIVSDDDIYTVVDSIVIDEVDAPGLLIDSNGGRAQVLGGDIETSGDNSEGLWLEAAGDAYADLGEVVTHGDGSTGIYARSEGQTVTSPYGYGSYTVGSAHVGTVAVETFGENAVGIHAVSDLYNAEVQSQTLVTHGNGSAGIVVEAYSYGIVDSNTLETHGDDATGITVTSQLASVRSNSVTTEGDRSAGIDVAADIAARIESTSVETSGDDSVGIRVTTGTSSAEVYSESVITSGERATGVDIDAVGGVFFESESIETSGDDAFGILAISREYNLYGTSGSVATTGDGAVGISVAALLDADLTSGTVTTAGDGANGIEMATTDGTATLISGNVTTTGSDLTGILVESENGGVNVSSETVSTSGENARGIHLISGGNATLDAGDVTTDGDTSIAVEINAQGNVEAAVETIHTSGDYSDGFVIWNGGAGTDADLTLGSVTIEGYGSYGVVAVVNGEVSGSVDSVTAMGNASTGVLIDAGQGVALDLGTVDITSEQHSIGVEIYAGQGDMEFSADSISVDSDGAAGVTLFLEDGDITADIGSVYVSGGEVAARDGFGYIAPSAVKVTSENGGIALKLGDVTVEAEDAYSTQGIDLTAQGHIQVEVESINVSGFTSEWEGSTGFGDAIRVSTRTSANIVVNQIDAGAGISVNGASDTRYLDAQISVTAGDIVTHANYGDGISVRQFFGNTDIAFDSIRTEGSGAAGVSTFAGYEASFYTFTSTEIVGGEIETLGDYSVGMDIASRTGGHRIEIDRVATSGARSTGIQSQSVTSGEILVGSVETAGDYSIGIHAEGLIAPPINETEEIIETDGLMIEAGSVTTTGDSAQGIVATGVGPVTIKVDSVETTGGSYVFDPGDYYGGPIGPDLPPFPYGSGLYGGGDGELPAGPASIGIEVASAFGDITVEAGSVVTSGDGAHGLSIDLEGDEWSIADQSVTVGTVQTTGADADALYLRNQTGGAIEATVQGDVLAEQGAGVRMITNGETSLTIAAGGALRSAADGYALIVEDYVAEELPEDGPGLPGPIGGGIGLAAAAQAIPTELPATNIIIADGGALYGRVRLDDRSSHFDNGGTFFANGISYFGGGNDVLTNSGTIAVEGDVFFDGLEQINNQGLIAFSAGNGDDVLDLSNLSFHGDDGSTIAFDLSAEASGEQDELILRDVTGTTSVRFSSDDVVTLDTVSDLISFTGDVADDAFVMAAGAEDAGFLNYRLTMEADTLAVAMAPDIEVLEPVRLGSNITDSWQHGTDAWAKQTAQARIAPQPGVAMWAQYYGGSRDRDAQDYAIAFDGADYAETLQSDTSYSGGQGGVAYTKGNTRFGLTLGFGNNETTLAQTDNRYRVDSYNVGVHGGWTNGMFFVDALAKADFADVEVELTSVDEDTDFDTTAFGLAAEAGARLGDESYFIEPVVGINWVSAEIDTLNFTGASFSFDTAESMRLRTGARAGTQFESGGLTFIPHLGLFAEKELSGENGIAFTSGSQTIALADKAPSLYGRGEAGLTLEISERFVFFAEGELLFGDVSGGTGRGGFRLRF
ncbi:autotransporter domain-containing protein [Ponticaulis profundi]|uniref:Autotransporter domain-containing protein n=1 Tax=Ponticaulis profundi TaxID=2665222 RepID=A0ABW1SCF3_9PROT